MKPEEFDFIASLLKEYSGFSLVPSQLYLLESRLGPLLRQNNLIGLEDLVTSLKLNNTECLLIFAFKPKPVLMHCSTHFSFKTGNWPGIPQSKNAACVFGSPPNSALAPENTFDLDKISQWTSSPQTISQSAVFPFTLYVICTSPLHLILLTLWHRPTYGR